MHADIIDAPEVNRSSLLIARTLMTSGYTAFVLGQLFRYMHWPFAAMLMYVAILLLAIGTIVAFSQTTKQKIPGQRAWALLHAAIFLSIVHITFRGMYFDNMGYVLIVTSVLIAFILYTTRTVAFRKPLLLIGVVCTVGLSAFLQSIPRHSFYYFFNIKESEENSDYYPHPNNYRFYSYLLYRDDKFDDALTYNAKAMRVLPYYEEMKEISEETRLKIQEDRKHIIDRTWNGFFY